MTLPAKAGGVLCYFIYLLLKNRKKIKKFSKKMNQMACRPLL